MAMITPQPNAPLISSESQANLLTVEESLRDAELEEVLDDLSSRFILNMPEPELSSTERISFQIEQAHWYYEDFVRPLNPAFPSMSLKRFSAMLFKACPLLNEFSHEQAFEDFQKYKSRVPVCGAVLMNPRMDKCVLVKGWKSTSAWSFPKGKINENESRAACAIREVREETGFDFGAAGLLDKNAKTTIEINEQSLTLYFVPGVPEDTVFETQTRKEISKIEWFALADLPTWSKKKVKEQGKFYLVSPFVSSLRAFISAKKAQQRANGIHVEAQPAQPHGESDRSSSLGPVTPPGAGIHQISQAPQPAPSGPTFIQPKTNDNPETDTDRMSRLLSALSTGSSSTVTSGAPPPPSAPVPALSPQSNSSERTSDKHIALLDSLLGGTPGPSPGATQRKTSEGRPLPPIPSGSRAFPSNGPGGHPFPVNAPSPPRQAPVPAPRMVPAQPQQAPEPMYAPPPGPPYHNAPSYAVPAAPPPQPQPQQPSQPPAFLHNPQATYGYYPPAFGATKAVPSPQEAHKGALLSLLAPNPPSEASPQHQSRTTGMQSIYQSAPDFTTQSNNPRAKLGVAGGQGMGPSIPPRMNPPEMSMPPMNMPPMNGPFSNEPPLGPTFSNGPIPQHMNPPMNAPPPMNMNMYQQYQPPPFPPAGATYMPPQQDIPPPLPPPTQAHLSRIPSHAVPAPPPPAPAPIPFAGPVDYPYSGPSPDVPLDAFYPKGLAPSHSHSQQNSYSHSPGQMATQAQAQPRPRELQNLNIEHRRERVSGEQILYRPQNMQPMSVAFPLQNQANGHVNGSGQMGMGMGGVMSASAPMPRLDMPKPRQPENLLAILNGGPRPHL